MLKDGAMEPITSQDAGGGQTPGAGELITATTTETFIADVIEASRRVPVIVDFWAPWCGPCKQLTPLLEKVVLAARGAVKLVKMNIDEHPAIAQQLQIKSIPAVFAFKGGQPVDAFMGMVPESQLRAFIEQLAGGIGPTPAEEIITAAQQALAAGDLGAAAQLFAQAVQEDPGNPVAIAGLARCYLQSGDLDRARQTLGLAPPDALKHPDMIAAQAALGIAEKAINIGDLGPLYARLEQNPKDHEARLELAIALNAKNDRQGAVDQLLEIVEMDRQWNDAAARKQLVEFFDAYGPQDEITLSGRRRLSSILFS